jgi:hypothetical protein
MKPVVISLIGALFLVPLYIPAVGFSVAPDTKDREIVDAVFSYQLEQYSKENRWNVFYLALGHEADPAADESVETFSKHRPPVKKFIKAEYDATRIQQEKGLVLGVMNITNRTDRGSEVEGYIFVLPGEAKGFRYNLIRENGKWIVKSSQATWIA